MSSLKVFSGRSNPSLAAKIAEELGEPLGQVDIKTFSDGEIRVEIADNVRGRDVFLIQSTCPPTNHNLMELLLMIDALKRASAGRRSWCVAHDSRHNWWSRRVGR